MTPSPNTSPSSLWPLNPTMSHNNNKNNGGLHACVGAAEDVEPFLQLTCIVVECESKQQFERFWFPCTGLFIFFLLCLVSPSTVCLYTAWKFYAHTPSLLLFWWISSATYRPGIWTTAFESFSVDPFWTQIFLKQCRGKQGKKDCFGTCGHCLNLPLLLPVATSESLLLLVKYGFDVFCYPRLVVWVTKHSPCWDNAVHTENDIVCNGLSKPINVLSI